MKYLCCYTMLLFAIILQTGASGQVSHSHGSLGRPADYDKYIVDLHKYIADYDILVNSAGALKKTAQQLSSATLPAAFDWRNKNGKNMVTPSKNQGKCGSCWAFTSTALFESQILINDGSGTYSNTNLDLSEEQQIVCNTLALEGGRYFQTGCDGGDLNSLRFWLQDKHSPLFEKDAPYLEAEWKSALPNNYQGICDGQWKTKENENNFHLSAFHAFTTPLKSNEMKASIYKEGPAHLQFTLYNDFDGFWDAHTSGEIYYADPSTLPATDGYHEMLIIGWDDAKQAWLCKNSWWDTQNLGNNAPPNDKPGPNGDGTIWIAYSSIESDPGPGLANAVLSCPFFPVTHQAPLSNDQRYSGIAVSSMLINKVADFDAIDMVTHVDQPTINTFLSGLMGPIPATGSTSRGIQLALQQYTSSLAWGCHTFTDGSDVKDQCLTSPVGGSFNWSLFKCSSRPYLDQMLYILAWYNLNYRYAAAIPLQGDYKHWVVVEGVSTNYLPLIYDTPPLEYVLYGLWIEDPDPSLPQGYSKSFKPTSQLVVNPANPNDPANEYRPTSGSYYESLIEMNPSLPLPMAIAKPAAATAAAVAALSPARVPATSQFDPAAAAQERIIELRLFTNNDFDAVYRTAKAGTVVPVKRVDGGGDFYLVPFVSSSGKNVGIVVRLDARTGDLIECAYNPQASLAFPVDPTKPLPQHRQFQWGKDFGKSAYFPVLAGDLNGDGKVDCRDRNILLRARGSCKGKAKYLAEADYDNDGCVTSKDLCKWEQYRRDYERYAHRYAPRRCGSPTKCGR
jgi:C1A family cysteine protease